MAHQGHPPCPSLRELDLAGAFSRSPRFLGTFHFEAETEGTAPLPGDRASRLDRLSPLWVGRWGCTGVGCLALVSSTGAGSLSSLDSGRPWLCFHLGQTVHGLPVPARVCTPPGLRVSPRTTHRHLEICWGTRSLCPTLSLVCLCRLGPRWFCTWP